jgi:CheY-like chemotaxis protein
MAATILFVDDEAEMLKLYELVHGSEYTVLTAASGEEALDAFGDHIDFAFFDRRMPDMSGDEVIRTLREEGYQTPFGIISAIDPDGEIDIEYQTYLTKPMDKDEVRTTIQQHVPASATDG